MTDEEALTVKLKINLNDLWLMIRLYNLATKEADRLTRPHNNSNIHQNTFTFLSNKDSSRGDCLHNNITYANITF